MEYSRFYVRDYFANYTDDSRPCAMGYCPLMIAYKLPNCKAATTLDPELVRAIDRFYKETFGKDALPWAAITCGQIIAIVDKLLAEEARTMSRLEDDGGPV